MPQCLFSTLRDRISAVDQCAGSDTLFCYVGSALQDIGFEIKCSAITSTCPLPVFRDPLVSAVNLLIGQADEKRTYSYSFPHFQAQPALLLACLASMFWIIIQLNCAKIGELCI